MKNAENRIIGDFISYFLPKKKHGIYILYRKVNIPQLNGQDAVSQILTLSRSYFARAAREGIMNTTQGIIVAPRLGGSDCCGARSPRDEHRIINGFESGNDVSLALILVLSRHHLLTIGGHPRLLATLPQESVDDPRIKSEAASPEQAGSN
jgi:hypothetical protein